MADRTRDEHLAWCKERALECVESGDLEGAIASMTSDLGKHEETALTAEMAGFLTMAGALDAAAGNVQGVRNWIEGFN